MPHLVWALGVVEAIGLMSAGMVVGYGFGRIRKLSVVQRRVLRRERPELPAAR